MKNAANVLLGLLLVVLATSPSSVESARKVPRRNNSNRRANVPVRREPPAQVQAPAPAPYQYYYETYQQQPQPLLVQFPSNQQQPLPIEFPTNQQQPQLQFSYQEQPRLPVQPQVPVQPGYVGQYGYQNQPPFAFGMG